MRGNRECGGFHAAITTRYSDFARLDQFCAKFERYGSNCSIFRIFFRKICFSSSGNSILTNGSSCDKITKLGCAGVAQSVEQLIRNQQVAGSSPATSSSPRLCGGSFFERRNPVKQRKYLPLVLFFLILVFIWGQSILPTRISNSQSRFIAIYLAKWFGRNVNYVNHTIRKCAHFAEFAVLGAAAAWLFGKRKYGYVIAALIGFGCAFLDETIQIFSRRGPAISDVWLDFSGMLFGLLIGMVLRILKKRRNP